MNVLEFQLEKLEMLVKAFANMVGQLNSSSPKASIAQPKMPGRPRGPGIPKSSLPKPPPMPGVAPPSQKNPVKIAEQTPTDSVDTKVKQAKEGLAFNPGGQWKLKKGDEE